MVDRQYNSSSELLPRCCWTSLEPGVKLGKRRISFARRKARKGGKRGVGSKSINEVNRKWRFQSRKVRKLRRLSDLSYLPAAGEGAKLMNLTICDRLIADQLEPD